MKPLVTPSEVVSKGLYLTTQQETQQTDKWEMLALRRSLTSLSLFRRFRSSVRSASSKETFWKLSFVRPPAFRYDDLTDYRQACSLVPGQVRPCVKNLN